MTFWQIIRQEFFGAFADKDALKKAAGEVYSLAVMILLALIVTGFLANKAYENGVREHGARITECMNR